MYRCLDTNFYKISRCDPNKVNHYTLQNFICLECTILKILIKISNCNFHISYGLWDDEQDKNDLPIRLRGQIDKSIEDHRQRWRMHYIKCNNKVTLNLIHNMRIGHKYWNWNSLFYVIQQKSNNSRYTMANLCQEPVNISNLS